MYMYYIYIYIYTTIYLIQYILSLIGNIINIIKQSTQCFFVLNKIRYIDKFRNS